LTEHIDSWCWSNLFVSALKCSVNSAVVLYHLFTTTTTATTTTTLL